MEQNEAEIALLFDLVRQNEAVQIEEKIKKNPELLYAVKEGISLVETAFLKRLYPLVQLFIFHLQDEMHFSTPLASVYQEKRKLLLTRLLDLLFLNQEEVFLEDSYQLLLFLFKHKERLDLSVSDFGRYYQKSLKWQSVQDYDTFLHQNMAYIVKKELVLKNKGVI